ncbi:MAG TPA: hypothetical protein VES40_00850 [Ilumatobacteraceae bacterium]|nr:hypothetical protein [Ilumatobacteraceae bacterium]
MRQLFSWRFVAAIAALGALALLGRALLVNDDSIESVIDPEPIERRIDVFQPVVSVEQPTESLIDSTGVTTGYIDVNLTGDRVVRIAPGTLGEIACEQLERDNQCVLLADTLGDAVVWFSMLPAAPRATVELPPIIDLDEGEAVFENGWRVPYAPMIERDCEGEDIPSFSDFLERFGPDSVTIVDLETRQVVAVRCGEPVAG